MSLESKICNFNVNIQLIQLFQLSTTKLPKLLDNETFCSHFSSPVKSIFEGATKYNILHYLEDARDRGLTYVELDLEEEADEHDEEEGKENN